LFFDIRYLRFKLFISSLTLGVVFYKKTLMFSKDRYEARLDIRVKIGGEKEKENDL